MSDMSPSSESHQDSGIREVPKCLICECRNYPYWTGAEPENPWCWRCGTYWSGEGNHLGLSAAEAKHLATDNDAWLDRMTYGPPEVKVELVDRAAWPGFRTR